MPQFQDPVLEQQKKALGTQIDALEAQIDADPDNSDLQQQLDALESLMQDVQSRRKAYRSQRMDEWKASRSQPATE